MKKGTILLTILLAIIAFGFSGMNVANAQGAVSVTVLDAEGDPVAGAFVTIVGMDHERRERPYMQRGETGDNGVIGWRQVPQGRYTVTAMARELGGAREVIGVRDEQVVRLELTLQGRGGRGGGGDEEERETGSIIGIVTDADGEAVPGAYIFLMRAPDRENRGRRARHVRTRADREGMFNFEDVPVGDYLIGAVARGIGADREAIEVVADQATRIRLQLQGRDNDDDDDDRGDRGDRGDGR
ncbi:MAG: carboxypeptidase-like regulatory domain-containing protein [Candidatus Electryoneaceae bacterium]|nr:carboxypeptidase-like regulatory domain-containing protein [Candidatus Electryoneaceae bacterium]